MISAEDSKEKKSKKGEKIRTSNASDLLEPNQFIKQIRAIMIRVLTSVTLTYTDPSTYSMIFKLSKNGRNEIRAFSPAK
jgi:hypothetical protein